MERDFQKGHIEIDFETAPFTSAGRLLIRSGRLFLVNLPFLAALTLVVYLPAKLLIQLGCYVGNVPGEGLLSYFLMEMADLALSALVIPAALYALVEQQRSGRLAGFGESLRWGWRQWGKTLWNKFKVEITVSLSLLLLIVPGLVAMVKLVFTDAVVAIEGDRETAPLERSRKLSAGHRWNIFLVLLPLGILDMGGTFLAMNALESAASPRVVLALAGSLLAVAEHWLTAAVLLMYLGVAGPGQAGRPGYEAAATVSRDRANSAAPRIISKARKIRSTSSKP
jgi:hypothetical protein